MAIVEFELTMPGRNSWNGKWSGEDKAYLHIRNMGLSKKAEARTDELVANGPYHYNFGDGWRALVRVRKVTAAEAKKSRKRTAGFCGYDWMITSILEHGVIRC